MNAKDYEKLGAVGWADVAGFWRLRWTWTGTYWVNEQEGHYIRKTHELTNFQILHEGYTPPLEEPTKFPALVEDEGGFLYVSNGGKVGSGTIKWHQIYRKTWVAWSDLTVTKIYKVGE